MWPEEQQHNNNCRYAPTSMLTTGTIRMETYDPIIQDWPRYQTDACESKRITPSCKDRRGLGLEACGASNDLLSEPSLPNPSRTKPRGGFTLPHPSRWSRPKKPNADLKAGIPRITEQNHWLNNFPTENNRTKPLIVSHLCSVLTELKKTHPKNNYQAKPQFYFVSLLRLRLLQGLAGHRSRS